MGDAIYAKNSVVYIVIDLLSVNFDAAYRLSSIIAPSIMLFDNLHCLLMHLVHLVISFPTKVISYDQTNSCIIFNCTSPAYLELWLLFRDSECVLIYFYTNVMLLCYF